MMQHPLAQTREDAPPDSTPHQLGSLRRRGIALAILIVAMIEPGLGSLQAQDKNQTASKDEPKLGWSNSTDLSLVVTEGNSQSTTLGFSNELGHVGKNDRFDFDVSVVRADKSDDRYFLVEPGLEFPVGGAPGNATTTLIVPEPTLDVGTYSIRMNYERDITPKMFWSTGASWYRNDDAGILNRYSVFGGLGHKWMDNQRRRFATAYGISLTDREEEKPDPEKERRFGGARAGWDYAEHFSPSATFDSDLSWNLNFADSGDYSIDLRNVLTVSVAKHFSLKFSLQWLFEHEPALESDLDVIAHVEVVNPDGVPGSGDERFRTLESGGIKLVLGTEDARKDRLDTVIRSALVIGF